ncbi:MAG TPA: hypothetical protein VM140_07035 [Burkholderiales bacterium]|nr:hypothetical protein [Burkholderiales bacterium]
MKKRQAGAYGAEYAALCALIACALVLAANFFSQQIARVVSDISCGASAECAASVARALPEGDAAASAEAPSPAAQELARHTSNPLP